MLTDKNKSLIIFISKKNEIIKNLFCFVTTILCKHFKNLWNLSLNTSKSTQIVFNS